MALGAIGSVPRFLLKSAAGTPDPPRFVRCAASTFSCSALLSPASAGEQSETAKAQKGQRRRLRDHHQIDDLLAAA